MELPKGYSAGPWEISDERDPDAPGWALIDSGRRDERAWSRWFGCARVVVRMQGEDADTPEGLANAALIALAPTMAAWIEGEAARTAEAVAAARREALEQAAAWIEPQRADVPAHGWEFAAAIRAMKDEQP